MSRYIDVDDIKYDINLVWFHRQDIPDDAIDEMLELIDKEPSADVEPVRHGAWKEVLAGMDYEYECTRCKACVEQEYPYCPNCGAKMGNEQEHE